MDIYILCRSWVLDPTTNAQNMCAVNTFPHILKKFLKIMSTFSQRRKWWKHAGLKEISLRVSRTTLKLLAIKWHKYAVSGINVWYTLHFLVLEEGFDLHVPFCSPLSILPTLRGTTKKKRTKKKERERERETSHEFINHS